MSTIFTVFGDSKYRQFFLGILLQMERKINGAIANKGLREILLLLFLKWEKCKHAYITNKNDPVERKKLTVWQRQRKIARACPHLDKWEWVRSTGTEIGSIECSDSSVVTGRKAEHVRDDPGWWEHGTMSLGKFSSDASVFSMK